MKSKTVGHKDWLKINYQLSDINTSFSVESLLTEPLKQLNFQEAADYTAHMICQKYNDIHIAFSGGIDSEFVAKVFLRNKLKFTPIILLNATNEHESWYAFKFCRDNNLELKIIDYRGYDKHQELLKKTMRKSLKLGVKPNASIISNLLSDMVDAPILTGAGDCYCRVDINDVNKPYNEIIGFVEITEMDFYVLLENKDQPGPFFCYTPEILLTSLTDLDPTESLQVSKAKLYDVIPRPKMNGVLHEVFTSARLKKFLINQNEEEIPHVNYDLPTFLKMLNK